MNNQPESMVDPLGLQSFNLVANVRNMTASQPGIKPTANDKPFIFRLQGYDPNAPGGMNAWFRDLSLAMTTRFNWEIVGYDIESGGAADEMTDYLASEGAFIDGTNADGDLQYHTYSFNPETGSMDRVNGVAIGAPGGEAATGSMIVGLGAIQTMEWTISVTGVTFASTFGVLGMTAIGVFLPTPAGKGSTQRENGIRGAEEILRDGLYRIAPPGELIKLRNGQGWKDEDGNIWKRDMLHKDHWDVTNPQTGKKVKEIDDNGNQIWPDGPKNKNKK